MFSKVSLPLLFPTLALFVSTTLLGITEAAPHSAAAAADSTAIDMGTTLVALTYDGGVVVGADTRTSVSGYVSNRYAHKWTLVPNNVLIGRSGSAADTQHLCDLLKWKLQARQYRRGYSSHHDNSQTTTVKQVAQCLQTLLREYTNENANQDDVSASLLCVGWDDENKNHALGQIYSIAPSGALVHEQGGFAVAGSGSTYILGHLDHSILPDDRRLNNDDDDSSNNSQEKRMDEEQAIQCVVRAIQLASNRDGGSGGMARIHVLNRKGRRSFTVPPQNQKNPKKEESPSTTKPPSLPGFAPAQR